MVYLEDLEEIVELVGDAGLGVTIEEPEFDYESLAAVRDRLGTRPLHELKITGVRPADTAALVVELRPDHVEVTWPNDELLIAGAATGIVDRLRERERPGPASDALVIVAICLTLLVFATGNIPIGHDVGIGLVAGAAIGAVLAVVVGFQSRITGSARTMIYVVYENEVESRWRRNRDVLLVVATVVATAIVTTIINVAMRIGS